MQEKKVDTLHDFACYFRLVKKLIWINTRKLLISLFIADILVLWGFLKFDEPIKIVVLKFASLLFVWILKQLFLQLWNWQICINVLGEKLDETKPWVGKQKFWLLKFQELSLELILLPHQANFLRNFYRLLSYIR